MFPIGIQIQIEAFAAESDLSDLIHTNDIVFENDLKARNYRKKPHQKISQYLNSRVPGRSKQIEQISSYVQNLKIGEKSPLCLHGSTGCGKTSIVRKLIEFLMQNNPQYQVLYINCLSYTTIRKIYLQILEQLFDRKQKKPQQALSHIFTQGIEEQQQIIRLIIFDEIDQCFHNKSFIYNILQWVQVSAFPFGIILISNMVDFSASIQNKSKSRIRFSSIIFKPYRYQQLIEIVKHKYYSSYGRFETDALIYLCKKIASINSDVRLLQKYYNDALRRHNHTNVDKICIQQVQSLFKTQTKGVQEIIKPYRFILQILWRSPRGKNIVLDIQHYCLSKAIDQFKQKEVMHFLTDLQQMKVLKINRSRRVSDYYYNSWGINLEQYAYTLQAMKKDYE